MFAKKLRRALYGLWGAVILLGAGNAFAGFDQLNMTPGVTDVSHKVYDLHMLIFKICVVICVGVFAVLIYSIINHRKSRGAKPASFHESTTVEIIWTTIPFLILVGMAVPATKTLLALEDTRDSDMSIKITGYQWKWKYDYLDEDISFFSTLATPREEFENKAAKGENYLAEVDNPIVVPINKKIRFLITSNDVIHSWWVPVLGWKQDAVPGFINDAWAEIKEPGTYRGKCAELCGKDHGFMPIVLVAKTEEDYKAWVAEQKAGAAAAEAASTQTLTRDELMEKGETVYNKICAACHQADGEGITGCIPRPSRAARRHRRPVAGSYRYRGARQDRDRHVRPSANSSMRRILPQSSLTNATPSATIPVIWSSLPISRLPNKQFRNPVEV